MNIFTISPSHSSDIIRYVILTIFSLFMLSCIYDRHEKRKNDLVNLDEKSLIVEIEAVQEKTIALKNAAKLNPVWDNWKIAKKVSEDLSLHLMPSIDHKKRSRNSWVGSITGKPLVVIAAAQHIQQKVAAQIITFDYMGSQAKIDIVIFGTDHE